MRDSRNCHECSLPLYVFIRGRGRWHTRAANSVLRSWIFHLIYWSPVVLSLFGWGAVSAIRAGPAGTPATPAIKFIFTTVILDHWLFKRVIHIRVRITRGGSRPGRSLICHCRVHLSDRVRGFIDRLLSSVEDKFLGLLAPVRSRLVKHFLGSLQCIFSAYVWLMIAATLVFFFAISTLEL